MEVIVKKSFVKAYSALPKHVQESIKDVLLKLSSAKSMRELEADCTKVQGYKNYYRVRIGVYRIGLEYNHPDVIVIIAAHRGSIYKTFPPSN